MTNHTVQHLQKAKDRFDSYRMQSVEAAIKSVEPVGLSALDALSAAQDVLPDGFTSFRGFETSRFYSRKRAFKIFDDAIKAQTPS